MKTTELIYWSQTLSLRRLPPMVIFLIYGIR